MDITPRPAAGHQVIQAYGGGGFRITGARHEGAVLVLPEKTLSWPLAAPPAIDAESLAALRDTDPGIELLLIGTGARMARIEAELRRTVKSWGIVLDAMDTGAACRTYNVLMLEERRVAAALLPVD